MKKYSFVCLFVLLFTSSMCTINQNEKKKRTPSLSDGGSNSTIKLSSEGAFLEVPDCEFFELGDWFNFSIENRRDNFLYLRFFNNLDEGYDFADCISANSTEKYSFQIERIKKFQVCFWVGNSSNQPISKQWTEMRTYSVRDTTPPKIVLEEKNRKSGTFLYLEVSEKTPQLIWFEIEEGKKNESFFSSFSKGGYMVIIIRIDPGKDYVISAWDEKGNKDFIFRSKDNLYDLVLYIILAVCVVFYIGKNLYERRNTIF